MFLLRRLSGRSQDPTTNPARNSNFINFAEDEVSRQALDQASEDVREGNYERALWILEKLGELDPATKGIAELVAVAEVCSAAVLRSCTCLTRDATNPDWYKVLKVDEKSDLGTIKKRYRHLALLLHPDKNKHARAEAAFKLISEAYACLSDKKRRGTFNAGKSTTKCRRCNPRDCVTLGSDRWSNVHVVNERNTGLQRPGSSPDLTQSDWILDQERLKMFRARARARVFGNLVKTWKERGFTGLEELNHGRERSKVDKGKRKVGLNQCKVNIHQHERKNVENMKMRSEVSSLTVGNDKSKPVERDLEDVIESDNVCHQQLGRPCKSLDVFIHELRAELLSGAGSTSNEKFQTTGLAEQGSTRESVLKSEGRDLEERRISNRMSVRGDLTLQTKAEHLTQVSDKSAQTEAKNSGLEASCTVGKSDMCSAAQDYSCPDGFSKVYSFAVKDSASFSNKTIPTSSSDKRQSSFENTKDFENFENFEERDHIRIARKKDGCAPLTGSILEKPELCRRIRRDDSIDMEETILQTQKEKSEQLLRTLQRLREETKIVAASLDQLCYGCSY